MDELKERLDGVYDFNNAKDCRSVIEILLRDLNRERVRGDAVECRLRSLALDVANDRPGAAKKASEALAGRNRGVHGVMAFLARMAVEMKFAKKLTNKELTDEVVNSVWVNLPMNGRDSALLSELIDRFRRMAAKARKAKK